MDINQLSKAILDSAFKVHTELGTGLLEGAYEACLAHELRKNGFEVKTQLTLPVSYDVIFVLNCELNFSFR